MTFQLGFWIFFETKYIRLNNILEYIWGTEIELDEIYFYSRLYFPFIHLFSFHSLQTIAGTSPRHDADHCRSRRVLHRGALQYSTSASVKYDCPVEAEKRRLRVENALSATVSCKNSRLCCLFSAGRWSPCVWWNIFWWSRKWSPDRIHIHSGCPCESLGHGGSHEEIQNGMRRCLVQVSVKRSCHWLINWSIDCLIWWLSEWVSEWVIDRSNDWVKW